MSLFDDNISNELSKTEKIRYWFTERVKEQFESYKGSRYMFDLIYPRARTRMDATTRIHHDLTYLFEQVYVSECREMGIYHVHTRVSHNLFVNKNVFKVIIGYALSPYPKRDEYETIKLCDLNIKDLNKYFGLIHKLEYESV